MKLSGIGILGVLVVVCEKLWGAGQSAGSSVPEGRTTRKPLREVWSDACTELFFVFVTESLRFLGSKPRLAPLHCPSKKGCPQEQVSVARGVLSAGRCAASHEPPAPKSLAGRHACEQVTPHPSAGPPRGAPSGLLRKAVRQGGVPPGHGEGGRRVTSASG